MKPAAHMLRFWRILKTIRRYGLDEFITPHLSSRLALRLIQLLPGVSKTLATKSRGVRLRQALEELGPIFIKFGQLLSTRSDLLPEDVIQELQLLQDKVPPFPGKQAKAIIEKTLGSSVDDIFSSFDEIAVAAASVAQVHEATLKNGDRVVVKVLRPTASQEVDRDISLMFSLARLLTRLWSGARTLRAVELVASFERPLRESLDLVIEAANASRFRANFEADETIYIPAVYWDYTKTELMVMEQVGGIPLYDIDGLKAAGIDLEELTRRIVTFFCNQIFRDSYFHADFHPGNVFIGDAGQIRLVDFGIMGSISTADQAYLAEMIIAITRRDYQAAVDVQFRSGWSPSDIPRAQLEARLRSVSEPIHDKPVDEIPIDWVLARLFKIMNEFGITVQPQLLLLQNTFGAVEGLCRTLHPDIKLSQFTRPYLENWARERYTLRGLRHRLRKEAPYWIADIHEVPRLAHEVLTGMRDDQLRRKNLTRQVEHGVENRLFRRITFTLFGCTSIIAALITWGFTHSALATTVFVVAAIVFLLKSASKSAK